MDDFLTLAVAMKLLYGLAGVIFLILVSRWLDRRAGVMFREVMERIRADAKATALYFGLRFLALAILLGMLAGCSAANASSLFPNRYDGAIRASVERWWPEYPDWLAWRAQLYQESRLNPAAVSPVGAAGLAQFMPGTWRQVAAELRLPPGASPHQALAINAGAYYMSRLRRIWSSPRTEDHRHQLAQASYNAGAGNILRAQSLCGGASTWDGIAPCLIRVTGPAHSAETRGYITSIARWRARMVAEGAGP